MSISALQINSFGSGNNVWDIMLRESAPPIVEPTSAPASVGSQPDSLSSPSSHNKMSGLFADAPREESRYLTATLQSFSIAGQIKTDMASQMYSLLDHFGGINPSGTYFPHHVSRAEVEDFVGQKADREILEASEELLEEMEDELDQKVEESLAPEEGDNAETAGEKEADVTAVESDGVENPRFTDVPSGAVPPNDGLSAEKPFDSAMGQSVADESQSLTEIIAAEAEAVTARQAEQSEEAVQAMQVAATSSLAHPAASSDSPLMTRAVAAYTAPQATSNELHLVRNLFV